MVTPKYSSILEQRRTALSAQLSGILPAGATFLLEIGSGHGHFLTAYAAAHPERICLGIDLIEERIERATRKQQRAKLANLHFVRAEARLFLEVLPPTALIDTVFVLFPDPWPKARHNKHRIIQPTFLSALAQHTVPECPLYFRTDFAPYYQAARDAFATDPIWRLAEETWPFEYATVFQQRAETFHSLVARCHPNRSAAKPAPASSNLA